MKIFLFFLFFSVFSLFSYSQIFHRNKPKFRAKIEDLSENFVLTGALYSVSDSGIILTCSSCKAEEAERFQINVSISKMDEISIKRNSRMVNWIIAGGVFGAAGFIYALLKYEGKDFKKPLPAYLAGFSAFGSLPFLITGLTKNIFSQEKIIVEKDKVKFSQNIELLKKYCFVK